MLFTTTGLALPTRGLHAAPLDPSLAPLRSSVPLCPLVCLLPPEAAWHRGISNRLKEPVLRHPAQTCGASLASSTSTRTAGSMKGAFSKPSCLQQGLVMNLGSREVCSRRRGTFCGAELWLGLIAEAFETLLPGRAPMLLLVAGRPCCNCATAKSSGDSAPPCTELLALLQVEGRLCASPGSLSSFSMTWW